MSDDMVEFAGQRMRPDLAAELVELELMRDGLERAARDHAEHGGKAECGCLLTIDGREPVLHHSGCGSGCQPLCPCTGPQHDLCCRFSMRRWLA